MSRLLCKCLRGRVGLVESIRRKTLNIDTQQRICIISTSSQTHRDYSKMNVKESSQGSHHKYHVSLQNSAKIHNFKQYFNDPNLHMKKKKSRADKTMKGVLMAQRSTFLTDDNYKGKIYRKSLVSILMEDNHEKDTANPLTSAKPSLHTVLLQLSPQQLIQALTELHEESLWLQHEDAVSKCGEHIQNNMFSFTLDELLYVCDLFYIAGGDVQELCGALFLHVVQQWKQDADFDIHQAVQLCFFMSVTRYPPMTLLHRTEELFSKKAAKLSMQELSIVCHMFYACNYSVRDVQLLRTLWDKLLANASKAYLPHIGNFMKVLRHSDFGKADQYHVLGDKLCAQFNGKTQMYLPQIVNIATSYSSTRHKHDRLFEQFSSVVCKMIKRKSNESIRVKDLGRYVVACSNLQVQLPRRILHQLEAKLRTDKWVEREFPEIYVESLVALALYGIYPADLVSLVLSPEHIKKTQGRLHEQVQQRILLDTSIGIDCPNYKGHRLQQSQTDRTKGSVKIDLPQQVLNLQLTKKTDLVKTWMSLVDISGQDASQCVKCHCILPFSLVADLEIRLDWKDGTPNLLHFDTGESSKLYETYKQKQLEQSTIERESDISGSAIISSLLDGNIHQSYDLSVLHLEPQKKVFDEMRVTIKLLGENQYLRNAPQLLGIHQKEVDLLRLAGYHVVLVPPNIGVKIKTMPTLELNKFILDQMLKPLAGPHLQT